MGTPEQDLERNLLVSPPVGQSGLDKSLGGIGFLFLLSKVHQGLLEHPTEQQQGLLENPTRRALLIVGAFSSLSLGIALPQLYLPHTRTPEQLQTGTFFFSFLCPVVRSFYVLTHTR